MKLDFFKTYVVGHIKVVRYDNKSAIAIQTFIHDWKRIPVERII